MKTYERKRNFQFQAKYGDFKTWQAMGIACSLDSPPKEPTTNDIVTLSWPAAAPWLPAKQTQHAKANH